MINGLYQMGSIIENRGKFFTVYKYKGRYYCTSIGDMAKIATQPGADSTDSLENLGRYRHSELDRPARLVETSKRSCGEVGEVCGEMVICTKKHGQHVMVPVTSLSAYDLNYLLHRKSMYIDDGSDMTVQLSRHCEPEVLDGY